MAEKRVSRRYAHALLDIASKEGLLDSVYADLEKMNLLLRKSKDFRTLVESPVIQYWRKQKCLREMFTDTMEPLTLNFILLLAEKRRENLIPSIVEEFISQYNVLKNRVPVVITSAIDLPENVRYKVIAQLEEYTQKTVLPDFVIDPAIKGGLTVQIDDWVYDASIRSQLDQLRKALVGV